jgi:serine protease Do
MNEKNASYASCTLFLWAVWGLLTLTPGKVPAQDFDFEQLEQKAYNFTVVIDMKLELSFGIHTSDQQERYLGTIVTEDGLVLFNGMALDENVMAAFSPFAVKTTPTKIEVTTLDGKKYDAEYLGVDRFTQIGFIKIVRNENERFTPIRFLVGKRFKVGEWLTLYMLLPEFVNPSLAADVGMVSLVVESPEFFPLTVGFSSLQMTSVLFDEDLEPVGVLGALLNPSQANTDAGGMLESFSQFGIPLLGVVVGERLEKLIADPPMKGQPDRGWLGITIQALTPEMAQFWGLDVSGGVIVNDIVSNSPAEKAGLEVGDIIYEVNGGEVPVNKDEKLPIFQRLIAELGPGTSLELAIIRRTDLTIDTLKLFATLEKAPLAAAEAPTYEVESLEFEVRDLVFADYLFYNLKPETFSGVVVAELKRGGLADVGGLQLGDIIQSIGNVPVTSIEEVSTIMESVEFGKPREVIFFVWRDNKTLFVNVKTDWD